MSGSVARPQTSRRSPIVAECALAYRRQIVPISVGSRESSDNPPAVILPMNTLHFMFPVSMALLMCLACTRPDVNPRSPEGDLQIELLGFEGCPNTPKMREHLKVALSGLRIARDVKETDLQLLSERDDRLRYGAPTILVNGTDLFESKPAEEPALSCRYYESGIPSSESIAERLQVLIPPREQSVE